MNGLTTGASYTFTVTAVNASGESEGATSNSVTLSGVPDRPGGPTVTAGDGTLTVKWDAPNDNGSPITSYTVYASLAGSAASSCTTNGEQECTIKSLVNDRKYTVTVVATNTNGSSQASPGVTGTPKATIQAPDKPVISKAEPKQVGTSMVLDLSWILGKSGSSGWGTTTIQVGNESTPVAGGSTYRQVSVTPGTTVNVSVTVTNLQGETATSDTRTVTIPALTPVREPKTIPVAPDVPNVRTPINNDLGKLSVYGARVKEGNGFKAADLTLFYSDNPNGCNASANQVGLEDFNITHLQPGITITYYFCQRGTKDDGSYVWGPAVSATGTAGNGQRSQDDDDDPIPTFEVQATASYVQKNRSWGVAASWTNPSGVEITQTSTWIEGLKDSTKQTWQGPLTNWWAEDLQPGHEYTIVVQVIGKNGQHREVKTTVKTGDVPDNVKATFEGKIGCGNGQQCGSMTLRAVNASNFQSGVTLVCSVKTGRPSSVTQFRFSRDNPQITGILTEAISADELLAKPPVVDCHAE